MTPDEQLKHDAIVLLLITTTQTAGHPPRRGRLRGQTAGTTCFMTPRRSSSSTGSPRRRAHRGIEVLVEMHSHYRRPVEIAARVDLVYDFALPPLVLHALLHR